MKLTFCTACGETDVGKLEHHHLVPVSAGGGDEETNLLTLCHVCHGKAHGYARADIRALSMAGAAAPGVRERQRRGQRAASARRKAAGLRYMETVVLPAIRLEFHGVNVTAAQAAAMLNSIRVKTPTGAAWTANNLRAAAARAGHRFYGQNEFVEWAMAARGNLEAAIGDLGCGVKTVARRLNAAGVGPLPDWEWDKTRAKRLLGVLGIRLHGSNRPGSLAPRLPDAPVRTKSGYTARVYSQFWRAFCTWRGHEEVPVSDLELAAWLTERLAGLSKGRATQMLMGVSHVHQAMGHDKLTLRPLVREWRKKLA